MKIYEQRLCEKQGKLFEESASLFPCSSPYFIRCYMNSHVAKEQDIASVTYEAPNADLPSLKSALQNDYPSLLEKEGRHYSAQVLHWMGYIYRAWVILTRRPSSFIYKSMKAEDLLPLYDSFHTFDPEYCVKRLQEIVEEKEGPALSDYEVYKRIKLGY